MAHLDVYGRFEKREPRPAESKEELYRRFVDVFQAAGGRIREEPRPDILQRPILLKRQWTKGLDKNERDVVRKLAETCQRIIAAPIYAVPSQYVHDPHEYEKWISQTIYDPHPELRPVYRENKLRTPKLMSMLVLAGPFVKLLNKKDMNTSEAHAARELLKDLIPPQPFDPYDDPKPYPFSCERYKSLKTTDERIEFMHRLEGIAADLLHLLTGEEWGRDAAPRMIH